MLLHHPPPPPPEAAVLRSTAATTMATGAIFHPFPVPFSRPQAPSASSSAVGEPPSRMLAAASPLPGRKRRTGSVGTWTGGAGGAVVSLPEVRWKRRGWWSLAAACSLDGSPDGPTGREGGGGGGGGGKKGGDGIPSSNYAVPMGKAAYGITRTLAEILRDLNKRVPPSIVDVEDRSIPWYHANRLLSFYAPGWCGEVRNVIFSENGSVTVVYRVTVRGSDGEAHRESTGTVSSSYHHRQDPVSAAEEIAFCRACARFGLGLYLYHEDKNL
uniref:DNA repair RAD52-like protein 2, chloroplastic n=1 Tax=Anthurium amnicola TaxID=1678845 RepID=A0A1D1XPJ1_9ARAE